MPQKTRVETIENKSFNAAFKNAMRNYYTYGFMGRHDFPADNRSFASALNDWDRLNTILGDDFSWSDADDKKRLFATRDTRFQGKSENPLHKLYSYCRYGTHMRDILSTLLILCPDVPDNLTYKDSSGKTAVLDVSETDEHPYHIPNQTLSYILYGEKNSRMGEGFLNSLYGTGLIDDINPGVNNLHKWKVCTITPKNILSLVGNKQGFFDALSFYSGYLPLGEIGTILQKKFHSKSNISRFIRFRHEYSVRALYDYNLSDILYASHYGIWCKIEYREYQNNKKETITCLPQKVRIDSSMGIEEFTAVIPDDKTIRTFRVEFVESVQFISKHSYDDVFVTLKYDPKKEPYFVDRFLTGNRADDYIIDDTKGLIRCHFRVLEGDDNSPWMRYLGHVVEIRGADYTTFPDAHGQEIHNSLFHEINSVYYEIAAEVLNRVFSEDHGSFAQAGVFKNGKKTSARVISEDKIDKIISEILGREDVIKKLMVSDESLDEIKTDLQLLIKSPPLTRKTGKEYELCIRVKDVFFENIPLTLTERMWLLSVLSDRYIGVFLSDDDVKSLTEFLTADRRLSYGDMFYFKEISTFKQDDDTDMDKVKKANHMLRDLLDTLEYNDRLPKNRHIMNFKYRKARENALYYLKMLEYSFRDKNFQGRFYRARPKKGEECVFNLDEINGLDIFSISECTERFPTLKEVTTDDCDYLLRLYDKKYASGEDNYKTATISFSGKSGIHEQILTEFAPWQKSCIYDRGSEEFTLSIKYWASDEEKDIAVRLLKYSRHIKVLEGNKTLYRQYTGYLDDQELLLTGKHTVNVVLNKDLYEKISGNKAEDISMIPEVVSFNDTRGNLWITFEYASTLQIRSIIKLLKPFKEKISIENEEKIFKKYYDRFI